MGMFDDVICKAELPDGYKGENFQTKDFDCFLDSYLISCDGWLYKRAYEWEKNEDSPLGIHKVNKDWELISFHGVLNFYHYDEETDPQWHEYNAKFTDGKLEKIFNA